MLLSHTTNGIVRNVSFDESALIYSPDYGLSWSWRYSVDLEYSTSIVIENCNMTGAKLGIVNSQMVTVRRNTIWHSIPTIGKEDFDGMWIRYSSDVNVTNNTIDVTGNTGMYTVSSTGVTLSDNLVAATRGATVEYSPAVVVSSNNMTTGVELIGSDDAFLNGNTLGGITIVSGTRPIITTNTIPYGSISLGSSLGAKVSANKVFGVRLGASHNALVEDNTFTSNGISPGNATDPTVTPDNLLDGKPIYFYKDCRHIDLDNVSVGEIVTYNCTGLRLANLKIAEPVYLFNSDGALLDHNVFSSWLTISGHDLTLVRNVVAQTSHYSDPLSYHGEPLRYGLWIQGQRALVVNNTIFGGMFVDLAKGTIIHNSLLGGIQVPDGHYGIVNEYDDGHLVASTNRPDIKLDNGYPSGGNYYGFSTPDQCSGPQQNICPDPDGIIDQPYLFYATDNYPLSRPYDAPKDISSPKWLGEANLSGKPDAHGVTLTWTAATDDQQVVVYRIIQGDIVVAYVPGTMTNYTVTGLTTGMQYIFKISAADSAGNWSPTLTVIIETAADAPSCCSFLLSWPYVALVLAGTIGGVFGVIATVYRTRSKRSPNGRTGT